MRENLFKKYGVYDKEKDLLTCKALLEMYQNNQQAASEQAKALNKNVPVNKTYPLAYNAYNLDNDTNNENNNQKASTDSATANADDIASAETKKDESIKKVLKEKEIADFIDNKENILNLAFLLNILA